MATDRRRKQALLERSSGRIETLSERIARRLEYLRDEDHETPDELEHADAPDDSDDDDWEDE
jgi:hypothetical protein